MLKVVYCINVFLVFDERYRCNNKVLDIIIVYKVCGYGIYLIF